MLVMALTVWACAIRLFKFLEHCSARSFYRSPTIKLDGAGSLPAPSVCHPVGLRFKLLPLVLVLRGSATAAGMGSTATKGGYELVCVCEHV